MDEIIAGVKAQYQNMAVRTRNEAEQWNQKKVRQLHRNRQANEELACRLGQLVAYGDGMHVNSIIDYDYNDDVFSLVIIMIITVLIMTIII